MKGTRKYLPLIELLAELDLLLDRLEELAVDLEHVDARASQLDLGRVLPRHGLVAHLPRAPDDLVLGEVSVAQVAPGRVPLLPRRFQFDLFERQLLRDEFFSNGSRYA